MPRKVLYVSPCAERAGAEQLTKLFIVNHDPERWTPEILFFKDGPFREELSAEGIVCHVAPPSAQMRLRNPASILRMAREISALVKGRKIDLVHSIMGYGHIAGGLGARLARVPEVWFQHGPTGPMDYLTGLVPSRTVLVNSIFTRDRQARYKARAERISLVYPAVDPKVRAENYLEAANQLRRKWCRESDEFVFGLVGRISMMKGQHLFVEAAKIVHAAYPRSRFVLIGSTFEGNESPYAQELQTKIAASGLADRFILTGYLTEPQTGILACDSIVNATISGEPFGLTLIEAMQLGRPVIAPRNGGPVEIFSDGTEGYFFKPRDTASLAESMLQMIEARNTHATWEAMSRAALERVHERFSLAQMMIKLEDEYDLASGVNT